MELAAPLIFVSIFVFASISLFLVYKFGIKKKSYEEALAEHRKQTSALLATKPKPKEKKSKKAAKKINKEKITAINNSENETPDDTESVDSKDTPEIPEKIKSLPRQIKTEQKIAAKISSKQGKIHVEFKEKPEEVPADDPVDKDVKEVINKKRLKRVRPILVKKIHDTVNILAVDVETPNANHFEEIHPKDEFELKCLNSHKEDLYQSEPTKEEKKSEKSLKRNKNQKQEIQQQPSPKSGSQTEVQPKEEKIIENTVTPLNQEALVNTGKEKKKKKSEYNARQQMTAERDQLVYSVRNAELSRTEVQLLIDVLLNKQLEAPAVIDEWSEGKADPIQKLKKQLAEKDKLLSEEQEALLGVQAKLKEVRNEQLADRAQLQQKLRISEESKAEVVSTHNRLQLKIRELEDLRNKELANFQRIVEDNKALQIQRGQLEAALMNYQETDALILNLKTDNAHLSNELQRLTQELHEQATNYQNCAIQIQTLQEELRSRNEYLINMERNHSFAMTAQLEEKRIQGEDLQRLTDNAHKEELQRLIDTIEQLKAENMQLQEDKKLQMNGSSDENKAHEVKLLNLTNELSSVKSELSSVNEKFQDAERQYQTKSELSYENYLKLETELEEQKNKNNELRKKNWKVMDALTAAEIRNKSAAGGSSDVMIAEMTLKIQSREQNAQKEFLQRLFPEIEGLKLATAVNWQADFEHLIKEHVSQLQQKNTEAPESIESTKLHNEIRHYKKIIDETEGMLNKLQSHIEEEERNWRFKLAQKEDEIEELKSKFVSQLQVKVSSLESQLAQEQMDKQRLLEEQHQLLNRAEVKAIHTDSTATIETLAEEINRLREQLEIEPTETSDASVYQNGKTS